ncbi:MAG: metallophosphoesterase family protein [Roseomonas sp.]|nr:metallophosphoesterase family protein [Roseomonas sp.]
MQPGVVVASPDPSWCAFAFQETTADQRAWLYALPERLTPAPGIHACHGTPSSDLHNLLEDPRHGVLMPSPLSAIRERLGADGMAARVVLCGHSHQSSVIHMPGDGPLVVNPGSLGLPGFLVTRGLVVRLTLLSGVDSSDRTTGRQR